MTKPATAPDHDADAAVLRARFEAVERRIESATHAASRPRSDVTLIAVSKHHPATSIAKALNLGHRDFGENYPQELVDKHDHFVRRAEDAGPGSAEQRPRWHFIGQIQRNKTRLIAERADVVHSVDRAVIAERLSSQRPPERGPLEILIQVDLSNEPGKGGVAPDDVDALVAVVSQCPNLRLKGLMAVPAPSSGPPDAASARAPFARLRRLRDTLETQHPGLALPWLSMGMSDDLEAAILEGATHVRIGTALFGPRSARPITP